MDRTKGKRPVRFPVRCAPLLAFAIALATPAATQERVPKGPPEQVHVVRSGDTLWDLAAEYLSNPFRWPEILRLNPEVVENPHWIFPSERLRIPGPGGQGAVGRTAVALQEPERTVFYETAAPRRQVPELQFARGMDVPVVAPGDFYRAGMLAREEEVTPVGRLVELLAPSVVPIDRPPVVGLYDKVFVVLSAPSRVEVGERLHFFRRGRRVKPYGWIYNSTGRGKVVALEGNTATVVVDELFDAVTVGDLAVPSASLPLVPGRVPVAAVGGAEGEIVAFQVPHPLQSREDVVFIDLGERSGVEVGDEFLAYLPPRPSKRWERPEVPVAKLQIVRVTDRTATARVADLMYPALEVGMPIRRIGAMP